MEEGRWDEATDEKARIEGREQARAKSDHYPIWFKREPDEQNGGEDLFAYQGGYWEAKQRQQWNKCPDIF